VFASEKTVGHRNRAIAYLERNAGMIDERMMSTSISL
jgi:glutaminase